MLSTSISEVPRGERFSGFTAVELLVGLAIAVCLAAALAPVWLSMQRSGETEGDRAIWYVQGRVAVARFERDLRLSGAAGCRFAVPGAILEAKPFQLVLLEKNEDGSSPLLVEWEIVKGSLMRRWGPCPVTRPAVFAHSLYSDSKTMLENLGTASHFTYMTDGAWVEESADVTELVSLNLVLLELAEAQQDGRGGARVSSMGRVGW